MAPTMLLVSAWKYVWVWKCEADVERIALKRKQTKTNDDTRYHGTILGKSAEIRPVVVEGGPVASISGWHEMLRQQKQKQKPQSITPSPSRRASSTLTSLEDDDVRMEEFV